MARFFCLEYGTMFYYVIYVHSINIHRQLERHKLLYKVGLKAPPRRAPTKKSKLMVYRHLSTRLRHVMCRYIIFAYTITTLRILQHHSQRHTSVFSFDPAAAPASRRRPKNLKIVVTKRLHDPVDHRSRGLLFRCNIFNPLTKYPSLKTAPSRLLLLIKAPNRARFKYHLRRLQPTTKPYQLLLMLFLYQVHNQKSSYETSPL